MNPQSHRKLALSLGSLESLIITFSSKHHVLEFSQETGIRRDTYMYREIYSEGLAPMVWRLRSPTICHLQAGGPGLLGM